MRLANGDWRRMMDGQIRSAASPAEAVDWDAMEHIVLREAGADAVGSSTEQVEEGAPAIRN